MEKLTKRSDGFVETPSGQFAVVPRGRSGQDETTSWLKFRLSPAGEVVRLEWPVGAKLVVIDADLAAGMLGRGYASAPSEADIEEYNSLVEKAPKKSDKSEAKEAGADDKSEQPAKADEVKEGSDAKSNKPGPKPKGSDKK